MSVKTPTEVRIFTRDRVVNFEEAVLRDTKRRTKGVGNASILKIPMSKLSIHAESEMTYSATNRISTRQQIATSKQTEGREESTSIITKAKSDLAGVCSLSESGDASATDITVVGHGVQGRAHATDICRAGLDILVGGILSWDLHEGEFLWAILY